MALHLVPPQPSSEESASNQGDAAEPCFDDNSSDLAQTPVSNHGSVVDAIEDHESGRDHDGGWLTPQDMAILKVLGSEPCPMNCLGQHHHQCLKRLPSGTKPVKLVGEGSANAVFEIKVPPRDRAGRDFKGERDVGDALFCSFSFSVFFFSFLLQTGKGKKDIEQKKNRKILCNNTALKTW